MSNARGSIGFEWMTVAIIGSGLLLTSGVAAQAEVVPPPPAVAPPQVVVVAPQPAPPQTVYVQPQYGQPQYGQTVYTPPTYQPPPVEQPRAHRGGGLGLIIGGAVMLGVGWICNIVASLFAGVHLNIFGGGSGTDERWVPFRFTGIVPVVGPWIQLGLQPTSFDEDGWGLWLVIDGLLQAAGLTLLIVGAVNSGGSGSDTEAAERSDGVDLAVVPMVGSGSSGLSLVGHF